MAKKPTEVVKPAKGVTRVPGAAGGTSVTQAGGKFVQVPAAPAAAAPTTSGKGKKKKS